MMNESEDREVLWRKNTKERDSQGLGMLLELRSGDMPHVGVGFLLEDPMKVPPSKEGIQDEGKF